jgi:hypothetical protein
MAELAPMQMNDDTRVLRVIRAVTGIGLLLLSPVVWVAFGAGIRTGLLMLTLVVPVALLCAIHLAERVIARFDRPHIDLTELPPREVAPAA